MEYNETRMFATGYTCFKAGEMIILDNKITFRRSKVIKYGYEDFLLSWLSRPFFWTGSVCVKRNSLLELNCLFPINENMGEDQDLWFRLIELYELLYIDIKSSAYYRVGLSDSLTGLGQIQSLPFYRRLVRKSRLNGKGLEIVELLYEKHKIILAANCIRHSDFKNALRYFKISNAQPFSFRWYKCFAILYLLPIELVKIVLTKRFYA